MIKNNSFKNCYEIIDINNSEDKKVYLGIIIDSNLKIISKLNSNINLNLYNLKIYNCNKSNIEEKYNHMEQNYIDIASDISEQRKKIIPKAFAGNISIIGEGATKTILKTNIDGINVAIGISKSITHEINVLKQITDHPNILTLYYTYTIDQYQYMFTEYCQGDLTKYLTKVRVNLKIYTKQLFLALKYMHDKNIAHGDIKLANILIGMDDQVRLADFDQSSTSTTLENMKKKVRERTDTEGFAKLFDLTIENYITYRAETTIKNNEDKKLNDIKALGLTILILANNSVDIEFQKSDKESKLIPGLYYMTHIFFKIPTEEEYKNIIINNVENNDLKDLLTGLLIENITLDEAFIYNYLA